MIIYLFIIMLILVFLGVPIVYSIGISSTIILLFQGNNSLALLSSRMFKGIDSFTLSAIPFFLLSAELLTQGGLIKKLISFVDALIGHLRGGLAHVNIVVSMLFAGIQASCTADSAAIGGALIPAMIEDGYDKDISVVVTATSSCLGPIIPPSILMVLYGFLTNTSVGKLFLGGVIPGIILGFSLMGVTHFWVVKRRYKPHREKRSSLREIAKTSYQTSPALIVPIIIIGGLVFGIVTPTEAGVLATLAALIVGGIVYRELNIQRIINSLRNSLYTVTVILSLIAASTVFAEILTRDLFSQKLLSAIFLITHNPTGVLALMALFIFFLGMAIDTTPLLIMLASVLYKAGMTVGLDPIHLGVVLVMASLIGTVSPPVSVLLCLDSGIAKIPVSETYGIIWSYLLVMLGVVFLCILVPETITWLPNIMKY